MTNVDEVQRPLLMYAGDFSLKRREVRDATYMLGSELLGLAGAENLGFPRGCEKVPPTRARIATADAKSTHACFHRSTRLSPKADIGWCRPTG